MKALTLISTLILSSCSFFGIQKEESPAYKVLKSEDDFEIREYSGYIVAKTTVAGDFDDSSGDAFRILAAYIFGKNKGEKNIAMTAPVEMQQSSAKIPMTSPVEMRSDGDNYTMAFSMPSKYKLDDLPGPIDERIVFEVVKPKIIASHQFSWFSSQSKNDKKVKELKDWLKKHPEYEIAPNYSYAGYNPPWTIPFLRRNEVHIELTLKK